MLERFRKAKAAEIAALKSLHAAGHMPAPKPGPRPSFSGALRAKNKIPLIAEYKRASPSRGALNLLLSPGEAAETYARAGAAALSILTEEEYFKGSLSFLHRAAGAGLPLLRKDFILHPLQIDQTAATEASAVLLVARMLEGNLLRELLAQSRAYGLEAVTEVFTGADLDAARQAGATIIQVNNRDLDTLQVNLNCSKKLVAEKGRGEFWITASGIEQPDQLEELLALGFDAALVGSALMQGNDPGRALQALLRTQGPLAEGQE